MLEKKELATGVCEETEVSNTDPNLSPANKLINESITNDHIETRGGDIDGVSSEFRGEEDAEIEECIREPSRSDEEDSEIVDVLSPEEITAEIRELKSELSALRALVEDNHKIQCKSETSEKKKRKKFAWVLDVAFYLLIITVVIGALLIRSSSGEKPFSFAGYSAFTVLTSSMEDVIPKGSLVITKSVDADTLQIGDDITFMSGPSSTITHRIVDISEKYADTNERAFKTKGTMNKQEDDWVPAVNVVGKVVYHNKTIGDIANFIKVNWPFLLFVATVLLVLFYVLKRVFREDSSTEKTIKNKNTDNAKCIKKNT